MKDSRLAMGTRSGLSEWILQRVTAVYLALFVLYILAVSIATDLSNYVLWKQWIGQGMVRLLVAGALVSVALHAWVGIRSVALDYIKSARIRFIIQSALLIAGVFCVFWGAQILMVDAVKP